MFRRSSGFTLIEILVVIAIIGILAATVTVYALRGSAVSRDAKRQADLKLLQAAVEAYKVDNGRYPEGCNAAGSWSFEAGTGSGNECSTVDKRYIKGLAPKYIRNLPRDPNRRSCKDTTSPFDCGYAYVTNADGSVYKIIAMNTVESEVVTYNHALKSCDINGANDNNINLTGFCGRDCGTDSNCGSSSVVNAFSATNHRCNYTDPIAYPSTDKRFEYSYAVWGGFAPLQASLTNPARCFGGSPNECVDDTDLVNPLEKFTGTPSDSRKWTLRMRAVYDTTAIICK